MNPPPDNPADLLLYHSAPLQPGPRPLWCTQPGCEGTLAEPYLRGVFKCPKCGKGYCGPDFVADADNWPEAWPGHRAAERKAKAAAEAKAASQQKKFKLEF